MSGWLSEFVFRLVGWLVEVWVLYEEGGVMEGGRERGELIYKMMVNLDRDFSR